MERDLSRLEARLHVWSAKLDVLAAKAAEQGQEVKIQTRMRLDELRSRVAHPRRRACPG
jgi:BMFP domain-containing protein YqiC